MVENEGVDAIKIAGTSWETLHLSCRTKLQKAIALRIMAIRRDRWFVQANERHNKSHCRVQREANAVELEHGSKLRQPQKKPRCWTNPLKGQYAYEWAHHSHRRTPLAKCPQKSIDTLRERDLGVGGPDAWLCKSCPRHGAQPHPRLVGRSPRELRRDGTVRQRVRTRKKCAQMSQQSQTWEDIRPATT